MEKNNVQIPPLMPLKFCKCQFLNSSTKSNLKVIINRNADVYWCHLRLSLSTYPNNMFSLNSYRVQLYEAETY